MELDGSPEASLRAKELLTLFRDRNMPVFHIQHISNRKGASFFLPDTAGVEIRGNVVDATVRAAFDHGFDCVVIHDACATRGLTFNGEDIPSEKVHGAFLAALGAVYAQVCSSGEFAAQIAEKAS